jgi:tol-pal system protein YbgF
LLGGKSASALPRTEPLIYPRNDDSSVVNSFLVVTFVALLPLLWVSSCATQTDIQAEQQAREALRTQIADSKASLEDLRREIGKVRGEVDEVRYRLDRLARERVGTGPQLKILEDRIALLEKQFGTRGEPFGPAPAVPGEPLLPQPTEPPATVGPSSPPPSSSRPTTPEAPAPDNLALSKEPADVQDEYKLALRAFNDQQYDKAIQQFRNFQRKSPNSDMADDAQYWIGESYFAQKDYNRAILEFNDVLKYRRGDKVPAALLRQAQAFLEIGDKTDARLILQKLVNDYPNSQEAREARDRLQTLGR